ncbi:Hypothetical predicted protein, partial [Lynx pardinus]
LTGGEVTDHKALSLVWLPPSVTRTGCCDLHAAPPSFNMTSPVSSFSVRLRGSTCKEGRVSPRHWQPLVETFFHAFLSAHLFSVLTTLAECVHWHQLPLRPETS